MSNILNNLVLLLKVFLLLLQCKDNHTIYEVSDGEGRSAILYAKTLHYRPFN
jgi:hypothetical protein